MPSLRKRVSSYLRQLSFHNEPKDKRNNVNENAFVTKYLQGHIFLREGPPIIYGKNPTDLPNYELGKYDSGPDTIIGCYSGPNGGLTTVKRTEKHLSVPDDDIDFIDNPEEDEPIALPMPKKSPKRVSGQPIDNTTMVIKVAGNEYCVTNKPKRHSKSYSLGSISDFNVEVEKTKIEKGFYNCDSKRDENSNNKHTICNENQTKCDKNGLQIENCEGTIIIDGQSANLHTNPSTNINNTKIESQGSGSLRKGTAEQIKPKSYTASHIHTNSNTSVQKHHLKDQRTKSKSQTESNKSKNYSLAKSRSEGHPFHNKKRGKIIQVQRPQTRRGEGSTENLDSALAANDSALPPEWNQKSDCFFGVSDSLYDRNQVTRHNNGDPIADCFGLITRSDSAILAVADGVNWGEKASIAAKSAVHASLHYLNKTIFNDTKPFENLTTKTDAETAGNETSNRYAESTHLIANTREVFVCLLRAFNCAHDLILENKGMLTTLTVAVVLPLKQRIPPLTTENGGARTRNHEPHYVCCVCNVGDTLAYVYSQRNGIRELTKGSHDVNSNRDMRDALGALGPVDGINPELSNLTLSITTLSKGDIVMVASDGLTDNFDPNVCRFTVNSHIEPAKNRVKKTGVIASQLQSHTSQPERAAPSHRTEDSTAQKPPIKPPRRSKNRGGSISSASQSERSNNSVEKEPPSSSNQENAKRAQEHFTSLDDHRRGRGEARKLPSVIENKASSLRKQASSQVRKITPPSGGNPKTLDAAKQDTVGYKFLKSKTSLDLRPQSRMQILRNDDGIPYITPIQRYELQLLLMEDVLKNGISGRDSPIATAKKLCESLVSFTMSITSAKRRTLEDQDMYFDNRNGILVEVSSQEKKLRRKKGLEKVQSLPGKLDHVTVVAYNVGNVVG